ncbi:GTPase Der [Acrasis kona]|uniref:GTPase Der n=1 Tax=Acrasis kona TaxID=1008807 RepID=A0AAW2ZCC0_9EUKA
MKRKSDDFEDERIYSHKSRRTNRSDTASSNAEQKENKDPLMLSPSKLYTGQKNNKQLLRRKAEDIMLSLVENSFGVNPASLITIQPLEPSKDVSAFPRNFIDFIDAGSHCGLDGKKKIVYDNIRRAIHIVIDFSNIPLSSKRCDLGEYLLFAFKSSLRLRLSEIQDVATRLNVIKLYNILDVDDEITSISQYLLEWNFSKQSQPLLITWYGIDKIQNLRLADDDWPTENNVIPGQYAEYQPDSMQLRSDRMYEFRKAITSTLSLSTIFTTTFCIKVDALLQAFMKTSEFLPSTPVKIVCVA